MIEGNCKWEKLRCRCADWRPSSVVHSQIGRPIYYRFDRNVSRAMQLCIHQSIHSLSPEFSMEPRCVHDAPMSQILISIYYYESSQTHNWTQPLSAWCKPATTHFSLCSCLSILPYTVFSLMPIPNRFAIRSRFARFLWVGRFVRGVSVTHSMTEIWAKFTKSAFPKSVSNLNGMHQIGLWHPSDSHIERNGSSARIINSNGDRKWLKGVSEWVREGEGGREYE